MLRAASFLPVPPREPRNLVRILEVEPDLAAGLSEEESAAARSELVAPCVSLGWTTQRDVWGPSDPAGHLGLMVIEGILLREVRLLGTPSAELLAHGDILRPWDADGEQDLPVPASVCWTALEPLSVAVLDANFVRRAASWPHVISALIGRTVVRAKFMALNDAITNVRRVDTRLLLLFWHLAGRWGTVRPETIAVSLPLTHEILATLVGAARPSVTTALTSLAERGLLRRDDGVWQLSRDVERSFGSLLTEQ